MSSLLNGRAALVQRADFDDLADLPARRITASPAGWGELGALMDLAVTQIPALAAAGPVVERVRGHDRDAIWAFRRNGEIVGAYAMLHLNATGLRRLMSGSFDGADPSLAWLATPREPVAAIYKWAVVAPRLAAEGIRLVSRHLRGPRYAAANLYARATTPAATRLMLNIGFAALPEIDPLLLGYVRQANRARRTLAA
ncbi:MAG: hypothetical protein ACWA6X_14385 [Bauldia sp.]